MPGGISPRTRRKKIEILSRAMCEVIEEAFAKELDIPVTFGLFVVDPASQEIMVASPLHHEILRELVKQFVDSDRQVDYIKKRKMH